MEIVYHSCRGIPCNDWRVLYNYGDILYKNHKVTTKRILNIEGRMKLGVGISETLKESNQMMLAELMNTKRVEEIVLGELIYL